MLTHCHVVELTEINNEWEGGGGERWGKGEAKTTNILFAGETLKCPKTFALNCSHLVAALDD